MTIDIRVVVLFGLVLSGVALVRLFRTVCGDEISTERFLNNATVEQYLKAQFYGLCFMFFTMFYATAWVAPR